MHTLEASPHSGMAMKAKKALEMKQWTSLRRLRHGILAANHIF